MLRFSDRFLGSACLAFTATLGLTAFANKQAVLPNAPESVQAADDLLAEAFIGIAFGDSVADVTYAFEGECEDLREVTVKKPYLPLAQKSQTHVIASGVPSAGVAELAMTFCDDKLVMLEARGGAIESLLGFMKGKPRQLGPLLAWKTRSGGIAANRELDTVWIASEQALQAYMFIWSNPDLPGAKQQATYNQSVKTPDMLRFGQSLPDFAKAIEGKLLFTETEKITPPSLTTKPKTQTQINCFGVEYAGFIRKVEAIFGDGRLQMAWILTSKTEEDRLRKELIKAYGKPIYVSEDWEVFDEGRVSLRKDKPEVMVLADELRGEFLERLGLAKK